MIIVRTPLPCVSQVALHSMMEPGKIRNRRARRRVRAAHGPRNGLGYYQMEPGDTLQFWGDIPHGRTAAQLPIRFLPGTVVQWCRRLTGPRRPAAA
jgi:hypothetical protein